MSFKDEYKNVGSDCNIWSPLQNISFQLIKQSNYTKRIQKHSIYNTQNTKQPKQKYNITLLAIKKKIKFPAIYPKISENKRNNCEGMLCVLNFCSLLLHQYNLFLKELVIIYYYKGTVFQKS